MATQFLPAASLRRGEFLPATRHLVLVSNYLIWIVLWSIRGRIWGVAAKFSLFSGRARQISDDALAAQCFDLALVIAETAQDLVGVLTEQWCGPSVGARGFGELDRCRRQRQPIRQTGVAYLVEQAGSADVRVVERLLRRVNLAGDDAGALGGGQRLGAGPGGAPLAHPRGDRLTMVGARLVVGKARVGEPVVLADHPRPAPEHLGADHGRDDPAVGAAIDVGRGRVEAAIADRGAVHLGQRLLDQGGVGKGDRGAQQGALALL